MTVTTSITVRVPLAIRRRPGRKVVVMPAGEQITPAALASRADPAVVKALARAFRYQRLLDEGRYGSVTEFASAEKIDRGYLGRLLRLTLLSPDLVEEILDDRPFPNHGLLRLLASVAENWAEQRKRVAAG
ncbi:hypothetical protein [Sediminicoccus rosea]|uniref:Uncharacterized protein n=1 Tax=Sediminicoccus rosea TaxID=1225128 RepID=A0ABZ0PEX2_9PROT|nr:hypothetical protein [Sediminicoccus rosea]WPB83740.1 hypothetical protein R9Z33_16685 [Sediminicoccus rosea]